MQTEKAVSRLPVAVTMGCPAGVGPEVVIRAFFEQGLEIPCVVVGDVEVLKFCAKKIGLKNCHVRSWKPGDPISAQGDVIDCLDVTSLSPGDFTPGTPSKTTGEASYRYILRAVELCQDGKVAAVATAPISKTGLRLAGVPFPGHTEMLADLTTTKDFLMMMAGSRLKVTLTTIHVPLRSVPELISAENILKTIRLTWQALKVDLGIIKPRLAVCGLNPHAGEAGMFGQEEEEIIEPSCQAAQEEGMEVVGPLPPDTVFFHAVNGRFDAVVCMYHDQGLIPFKLIHFRDGVNVTCGLPIVRTSVDHGTAYDIAWQGKADHTSMTSAIRLASTIHENRMRSRK